MKELGVSFWGFSIEFGHNFLHCFYDSSESFLRVFEYAKYAPRAFWPNSWVGRSREVYWDGELVSEKDGTDFNALISGLVQLMLDVESRSIFGFQSLVEKEWVALGHRFAQRCDIVCSKDAEQVVVANAIRLEEGGVFDSIVVSKGRAGGSYLYQGWIWLEISAPLVPPSQLSYMMSAYTDPYIHCQWKDEMAKEWESWP